jgi:hypothetical protein
LSTTTVVPSVSCSRRPSARANVSLLPPGALPTISVIVRHAGCDQAGRGSVANAATASAASKSRALSDCGACAGTGAADASGAAGAAAGWTRMLGSPGRWCLIDRD